MSYCAQLCAWLQPSQRLPQRYQTPVSKVVAGGQDLYPYINLDNQLDHCSRPFFSCGTDNSKVSLLFFTLSDALILSYLQVRDRMSRVSRVSMNSSQQTRLILQPEHCSINTGDEDVNAVIFHYIALCGGAIFLLVHSCPCGNTVGPHHMRRIRARALY